MSEPDELARTIGNALIDHMSDDGYASYGTSDLDATLDGEISLKIVATAVLAAGYRKPRTVTTVEELDALPLGSVILDRDGMSLHKTPWNLSGTGWNASNGTLDVGREELEAEALPATVLHEPAQP